MNELHRTLIVGIVVLCAAPLVIPRVPDLTPTGAFAFGWILALIVTTPAGAWRSRRSSASARSNAKPKEPPE